MVPVQVVVAGAAVRSAPLGRHDRSVRAVVAVTVTETGRLAFTSTVVGITDGVRVNVPGGLPVPLNETVRPGATVRIPLAAPTDAGENLTEIVQLVAAVPQVVLSMRNPAPVTVGLTTTAVALVTFTTDAGLLAPISMVPKLTVAGATCTATAGGPSSPGVAPVPSLLPASATAGLLLPPQPAIASMPTSPKQVAWSTRSKFLEHVM
jgi:hypothetical protein